MAYVPDESSETKPHFTKMWSWGNNCFSTEQRQLKRIHHSQQADHMLNIMSHGPVHSTQLSLSCTSSHQAKAHGKDASFLSPRVLMLAKSNMNFKKLLMQLLRML